MGRVMSVAAFPMVAALNGLTFFTIAVLAVVRATFDPAVYIGRRPLLADVGEATDVPLDRANGIHQGVFAVGWMVGPLVGAVLIATVGAVASFSAPFGLFVLAALAVTAIGVGDAGQRAGAGRHLPRHRCDTGCGLGGVGDPAWSRPSRRVIPLVPRPANKVRAVGFISDSRWP